MSNSNICGIIGVSTGWMLPIIGIALGIAALCRKERSEMLGAISIIEGIFAWAVWVVILTG